ncbi:hypothetical protein ACQKWADRAFT_69040 [Trichoderma austrokoningii]
MTRETGSGLGHKCPGNGPLHEDRVGRPMVRYLLEAYSIEQIQKLFEEEACALSLSPSLFSHPQAIEDAGDDDAHSILPGFESSSQAATSAMTCLPVTMSSPLDTVAIAFKPINGTILSTPATESSPEASDNPYPDSATVHQEIQELMPEQAPLIPANGTDGLKIEKPSKKKEYTCGFCNEYGIYKRLARPSDLKRHLESTHHTNNLWVCPRANCRRVFQWLGAFKEHARYHHKARIRICDAEVITLCPQTVFACGYEGCNRVYEALSGLEASPARDKFIAHVVNHLQNPVERPGASWTFTFRMRNLLSQSRLSDAWPPPSLSYEQNLGLNWDARSGSVLQKLLETRHLGDPSSLIRNTIALGSVSCREVQLARGNAVLPILGQCRAEVHHIEMSALQATLSPTETADATANCSESLIASSHSDGPQSAHHLDHDDAMQHILDSLHDQPVEQHYLSEDLTDPMEWITNNDGEEEDGVI